MQKLTEAFPSRRGLREARMRTVFRVLGSGFRPGALAGTVSCLRN